jgi:hypothetical protein
MPYARVHEILRAPNEIIVTTTRKGQPAQRRLVCAYPKVSQYKGKGDTSDPSNFFCIAGKSG